MDRILREQLQARMEDCLERGDHAGYQRAIVDVQIAQMECQEKTAQRVKRLEENWNKVVRKLEGARLTLRILGWLVSAIGGGTVIALIQHFQG